MTAPNIMTSGEINTLAGNLTNNVVAGNLNVNGYVRATRGNGYLTLQVDNSNNVGLTTGGANPPLYFYLKVDSAPNVNLSANVFGDTMIGYQGTMATTATGGFPYIPTCAGTPTGLPVALYSGMAPLVVDSTNSIMYFHNGTTWVALN
jgi:hypothetical protein